MAENRAEVADGDIIPNFRALFSRYVLACREDLKFLGQSEESQSFAQYRLRFIADRVVLLEALARAKRTDSVDKPEWLIEHFEHLLVHLDKTFEVIERDFDIVPPPPPRRMPNFFDCFFPWRVQPSPEQERLVPDSAPPSYGT